MEVLTIEPVAASGAFHLTSSLLQLGGMGLGPASSLDVADTVKSRQTKRARATNCRAEDRCAPPVWPPPPQPFTYQR